MSATRRVARRVTALLFVMLLPPLVAAVSLRVIWPAPGHEPAPTAAAPPVEATVDRTPEVRGRVLDFGGNPVSGAAVRLLGAAPPYRVVRDATTDAGGAFSFAKLTEENVRVVASHEPEGFVTSAELGAREGQTVDVTLVLSSSRGVRGTVVDVEGRPVAGATLSLEGLAWKVATATSDEAGTFHLVVVPDQASAIAVVARGYRAARLPLERRAADGDLVVRVVLTAAPAIVGRVLGTDGDPLRASVVACVGRPAEVGTESGDDGAFELPPATVGCEAVAQLAGYAPSDPVVVAEGARLVLRLKSGGAIEGVVVDDRGSGVGSFTLGIEAFAAGGVAVDRGPRRFEDPRGAFQWDKLAPGRYVLSASVHARAPVRSESIEVKSGAVTRGVRIVLAQGGSVAGHVYDDHHAPLAGADVAFDSMSSIVAGGAATRTDASGSYRLDGAPAGPFTLSARKDGFRTRLLSGMRVAPGGSLTRDVTLVPIGEGAGLELGGIGANLTLGDDGVVLAGVGENDPAARAGLAAGDHVVSIDGESTEGMSIADAVQRLRGEAGSSVGVSVLRPSTGQALDVVIQRATIVR